MSYYSVTDETALVELLRRLGRRIVCNGALIPTGDREVLFLSRNRNELENYFYFVLPRADVLERLANKKTQYQYATNIGIPMPQTHYPKSQDDLLRIAANIQFPCVIKPAYSHIWRDERRGVGGWRWLKAVQVDTPEQLRTAYEQMNGSGVELVVQERIEGADSRLYSFYVYLDRNSDPLALCVIQKLRQWPPEYGSGSYSVTCRRDEIVEIGLKLLRALGYVGIANLEFKHDANDGAFKLIEVNARAGERIALASAAGVDIPYIAYRDIMGEPTAAFRSYEIGVKWVNFVNDSLGFFLYYRKTDRLSMWRWMWSVLEVRSHAYFAWDDPLPFLGHLFKATKQIALLSCRYLKTCVNRAPAC
jgi:D-aspartate ligase